MMLGQNIQRDVENINSYMFWTLVPSLGGGVMLESIYVYV